MRIHIPQKTLQNSKKPMFVTQSEIPLLLSNTKGHIFTVTFTKKDNTIRQLNGRLGVKKYLKGGVDTTAHLTNFINVFDVHKKDYRKINMDTISNLVINKQEYVVQ
jgi:hypothetical protein